MMWGRSYLFGDPHLNYSLNSVGPLRNNVGGKYLGAPTYYLGPRGGGGGANNLTGGSQVILCVCVCVGGGGGGGTHIIHGGVYY